MPALRSVVWVCRLEQRTSGAMAEDSFNRYLLLPGSYDF